MRLKTPRARRAFDPSAGVRQPGNYSGGVQRCLSADQPVRGMNRASPDWGKQGIDFCKRHHERAFSVAVCGLDGEIVQIEADITSGLPGVHLVGLPDAALQESRDRVYDEAKGSM
jgi:hypothetical protein